MVLAQTYYDVPTWMVFQVIVPLVLVGLAVVPLWVGEQIKSAYAYIFGNGAFFIFAILLSVDVLSMIIEARTFSTRLEREIKLSHLWGEGLTVLVAFVFVYLYAANIFHICHCAIVQKMSLPEVIVRLRTWSKYGLIGAVGAISFALCELLAIRKALLKARVYRSPRPRV